MPTAKQIAAWKKEEAQVKKWKDKAEKWDALDDKIGKFYPTGEHDEPEKKGDLCDIGEVAARAFGYL